MIKSYVNILVMLFFSWSVYGYCQQDQILPVVAAGLTLGSLLLRLKSAENDYAVVAQISLSAVIIISFLVGMFWRSLIPIPQEANSPFPEFTAALQSGSIVAAILFWLRPFTKANFYRLIFCAWLTVALSVNVPFTADILIVFSSFCFVSVAIGILFTHRRPENKKYLFAYSRDFFIYSTVLIVLTMGLFLGIAKTIVAMERAFFNTMSSYILPRQYTHFLRISSQLNLISPGSSAFDRRPVMEVSLPQKHDAYLKMQVFDDYKNGTWQESKDIRKRILPVDLLSNQFEGSIMMFTNLNDLVPSPEEIVAIKAKLPYWRSDKHIIYAPELQNMRMLKFSLALDRQSVQLSEEQYQRYTALPATIAPQLRILAKSITRGQKDVNDKVKALLEHFHQNFQYSLEVDFSADDQGLLKMLQERRPAYCTYFASALTLLLRAEGIPARVAAGFFTTEIVDRKSNTYLARVNNAHAWTEVFLPSQDSQTGQMTMTWQTIDATPATFGAEIMDKPAGFDLERMFEQIWLGVLRVNAKIENMDRDLLKFYLLLSLLGVIIFVNRQKIFFICVQWIRNKRGHQRVHYQSSNVLRMLYSRYALYLKKQYGQQRKASDTDADVIARLRQQFPERTDLIINIQDFVQEFQAVRFGAKSSQRLEVLLVQLEKLKA